MIKIFDFAGDSISLAQEESTVILAGFAGPLDPRISSCVDCASAVVATEPFNTLIDDLSSTYPGYSELFSRIVEFVEDAESVHLYVWEENDCAHRLWMDPIAVEWTSVTGEKRLHN